VANTNEEIHKGDIGTVLTITVKDQSVVVDLSGATTKSAILESPTGVQQTLTLTFTTDGTDGKVDMTSVSGTFDESGPWKLQLKFIDPSGTWRTNIYQFIVYPNLSDA